MGIIIAQSKPVKSNKKIIIKPYREIPSYFIAILVGNNPERICDPSSGGMGSRLKTASKRLIRTLNRRIIIMEFFISPTGK